ncbi:MAG: hypothetical protein LBQ97_03170 [Fusobacteriaceae bacterium]|jgi:hypothetical protein|nr:hypothetical protein [Fusobacteriaceae bacterium]
MIDKTNGNLILDDGFIIRKGMTITEFWNTMNKSKIESDDGDVMKRLRLYPQRFGTTYLIISVSFFPKNILSKVNLYYSENGEFPSWRYWSYENEMENKEKLEIWLEQELGQKPPYRFAWGTIETYYDQKGASSGAIITYKLLDTVSSSTIKKITDRSARDGVNKEEEPVEWPTKRDREAEVKEAQEKERRYQEKFEALPESVREAYIAKAKLWTGYESQAKISRALAEKFLTLEICYLMEKDGIIV